MAHKAPHWAAQYIGKPWQNGGRGPDAFDCWGLLRFIYFKHLEIRLPAYPGINAKNAKYVSGLIEGEALHSWTEQDIPDEFSAVAMASGCAVFTHVGIYTRVDGGHIIHCADKLNVVAQRPGEMKAAGWARIKFYQYGSNR